jgi:HPt (histidine-containing phosphotransfer) domain-containing protein
VQFAKLERRYKDRARDMLEMFIEEAPVHIATMNEACAAADFQAIGRCAHGFKGICGALMLSEMKDCCFDLENVARQNDLSQVNNLSMRLEGLFRRVEQVVAGSSPSVEKKNE